MAANNVVGSVAVLIRPITRGFKKNIQDAYKDAVQEMQPEEMPAPEVPEEESRRSGSRFGEVFGKWAKRALVAAGIAIGAAVGATFVSGFRSALDQQQGQLVLSGLYGDAEKAQETLKGLRGMASSSPIDYSAYQGAAESLAYAGSEGEQAITVLENMGKAITAAGGDSSNMDRATDAITRGVNAGRFQLDTLQQLSDAGIPILSGLADHFGVSMEEVNKMASDGQIQLEDVMAVMESGTGDIFQQMIGAGEDAATSFSNQWKIAKDNISVAVGQVMLPLIELLAPAIKPASDAMVGFVEEIPGMLDGIRDGVQWVKDNIAWIGTLAGSLVVAGAAAWIASGGLTAVGASITGVFTAISTGIRAVPIIGWVITAIGLLVTALVYVFTQTEWGQQVWETVWGAIKTAAAATWDWIKTTLWPGILTVWDAISSGAIWLYENAILPAWNGIKAAIDVVWGWISGTLWPGIVAAWDAIAAGATWLYENIIQPVWTGIRIAIAIAVTAVLAYIDLLKWWFENVIAPVAMWLYEQVILPAWNGIKDAVGAVIDWIQNTGWPALKLTFELMADIAIWLYENALKPAWDGIKGAIDAVVTWLRDVAWARIISPTIDNISTGFGILRDRLKAVWDFIKTRVINPVVTWLRDTVWARIISPTLENIKSGFDVMRDSLGAAWDFIKDRIIDPVASWFRDTVGPLFDSVTSAIGDAFDTLRDTVKQAWDGIRDTAKVPVKFVVEKIVNDAIIGNYNKVADIFGLDPVSDVTLPSGWATGGYTGPGPKYQPAGVVHADEYVIRKESQQSLRRSAPGFLDALNTHGARALEAFGYATGGWVKPFQGNFGINSGYGMRGGRLHAGVDFPTPTGTPLVAVSDGSIVQRGWNAAAGNKISMQTSLPGVVAGYHHLSRYAATLGQSMSKGQVLGYSGNTGRSTGPHLHFSIKRDGQYVDPGPYLSGAGVAGSGEGGGFLNPFAGLWDSLKDRVREGVGDTPFGDLLFEMPKKMVGGALTWVTDKLSALTDWASDTLDSATGAARWTPVATDALMREGEFGPMRLASLLRRMGQESSYDPRAINNWDSNARSGTPSKGLMQVIQPTFDAHRDQSLSSDIYDPLANIVASIRYTLSRYGNLRSGWDRPGGYADGGLVTPTLFDTGGMLPPGITSVVNASGKPEAVLTHDQWQQLQVIADGRGGQSIVYENNVTATSDRATELVSELMWAQKTNRQRGRYQRARG